MSTSISHHVQIDTGPPRPLIHTYPHRSPIASVEIDDGAITIAAVDPQHLFNIADAFLKAGQMLAVAIARGPVEVSA